MAVTAIRGGFEMTANGDALNGATVGHAGIPYKACVVGINIVGGATPTLTTITDGRASKTIWKGTAAANSTTQVALAEPIEVEDLTVALAGTPDQTVVVFVA